MLYSVFEKLQVMIRDVYLTRELTNFDNIDWITVPFTPGVRIDVSGILPRLRDRSVVPDVTLVRKDVGSEADPTFLDVLKIM